MTPEQLRERHGRPLLLLLCLFLASCVDSSTQNIDGSTRISVVTAPNGVPCIVATIDRGIAISCDWSVHRAAEVPR